MASSPVLFIFRHGVETSNLGMYQHKNSVHQAGTSHLNKLGSMHKINSLDVNTAKYARSSRKVEEDKVTLCAARSSCNVQK